VERADQVADRVVALAGAEGEARPHDRVGHLRAGGHVGRHRLGPARGRLRPGPAGDEEIVAVPGVGTPLELVTLWKSYAICFLQRRLDLLPVLLPVQVRVLDRRGEE